MRKAQGQRASQSRQRGGPAIREMGRSGTACSVQKAGLNTAAGGFGGTQSQRPSNGEDEVAWEREKSAMMQLPRWRGVVE